MEAENIEVEKMEMETLLQEIEQLKDWQKNWEFTEFHEETAWKIGLRIREQALAHYYPIAVSVTLNRRCLFACSMPGAAPVNERWIRRKENMVYLFQKSSLEMARYLALKKDSLAHRYGLCEEEYAAAGGSVPVLLKGTGMVGAVTVSGLSEQEDHELVIRTIEEIIKG